MQRTAQQINGREGETATFLSMGLLAFSLCGGGFAPRQLRRCAASHYFVTKPMPTVFSNKTSIVWSVL